MHVPIARPGVVGGDWSRAAPNGPRHYVSLLGAARALPTIRAEGAAALPRETGPIPRPLVAAYARAFGLRPAPQDPCGDQRLRPWCTKLRKHDETYGPESTLQHQKTTFPLHGTSSDGPTSTTCGKNPCRNFPGTAPADRCDRPIATALKSSLASRPRPSTSALRSGASLPAGRATRGPVSLRGSGLYVRRARLRHTAGEGDSGGREVPAGSVPQRRGRKSAGP